MFGFFVGAVGVFALFHVLRRGYWRHGRGWGGGRRWMLRRVFQRLDTTPGQEKVILDAVDRVQAAARGLWGEVRESRRAVGQALRGERFDGAGLKEAYARQDAA